MPNIAKMLRDEIQRLARREIRAATGGVKKDNARLKHAVADLKRRLAAMESVSKRLAGKAKAEAPKAGEGEVKSARISGRMVRAVRTRLGLSQNAFASLVGVSSQAVYQWERKGGRLDLRGDSKAAIVRIRKLGKREVKRMRAAAS